MFDHAARPTTASSVMDLLAKDLLATGQASSYRAALDQVHAQFPDLYRVHKRVMADRAEKGVYEGTAE